MPTEYTALRGSQCLYLYQGVRRLMDVQLLQVGYTLSPVTKEPFLFQHRRGRAVLSRAAPDCASALKTEKEVEDGLGPSSAEQGYAAFMPVALESSGGTASVLTLNLFVNIALAKYPWEVSNDLRAQVFPNLFIACSRPVHDCYAEITLKFTSRGEVADSWQSFPSIGQCGLEFRESWARSAVSGSAFCAGGRVRVVVVPLDCTRVARTGLTECPNPAD